MSKKNTYISKAERRHLDRVVALGCIVCRNTGLGDTPAEIHHRQGGHGVAIHAGRRTWESNYGTELELLSQVCRELGISQ